MKKEKNDLQQGSVLAPTLFNINVEDLYLLSGMVPSANRCDIYAVVVVLVCHDQVRLQVSQGFRCRDS